MRLKGDAIAGVVVVFLAGAAALGATAFPSSSGAVPGPAVFPLGVAALWLPLGIALFATGLRGNTPVAKEADPVRSMPGLLALTAGYAGAIPWLGFLTASALYLAIAVGFLGYRHWWRAGAFGLSSAFLVHWIFRGVMNVSLPEGWIG